MQCTDDKVLYFFILIKRIYLYCGNWYLPITVKFVHNRALLKKIDKKYFHLLNELNKKNKIIQIYN